MNCFSLSSRGAFSLFLASVLIALFAAGCGESSGGSGGGAGSDRFPSIRDATPLPRSTPEELGIEPSVGGAIVAAPMPALELEPHPFLNNDGDSRIHNDHYNSAAYDRSGPVGPNIEITTHQLGNFTGICAMMTFLENGYVLGSCFESDNLSNGVRVMLTMFDNENLNIVAEQDVGFRPFVANAGGGAYFSLDKDENIFLGPATNRLEQYHIEVIDGVPEFVQDFSKVIPGLEPALEVSDPMLQDTVIDWEGRYWFMTNDGRVGYYDRETDEIKMKDLGEGLQNSMVVDDEAVYLVTFEALQRLSVDDKGEVRVDWRAEYDPGTGIGGILPGSGTSPTLLGKNDDLISICDNADGQINLLVIDRHRKADDPPLCTIPIFRPGESAAENTVVGYNDDIIVVNNGGFGGAFAPANTMFPGLERYRVVRDDEGNVTGCENVWKNDTSFGNSAQLATESGVIWGYGADPDITDTDVFYLTAASWDTGEEIFRAYVGDDKPLDPIAGQVHIHSDGTLYLGALRGVVMMRDVQ
jgi:hypothetical protein